ncbi:MAG: T9SS type A sorting domain-containing protein [Flavobacteriales bacterium]|nr:MAG: T9SS type A sorting domain-containing protein [Flavobacteriales bacterium]
MNPDRLLLAIALAGFTGHLLAQGEVLVPLDARPVPEALDSQRKSDGLNTHFIYQNAPQTVLPIIDDFSVNRTRRRWAQPGDVGVSLTETSYRLEVAGVSTPDMVFSDDTTFLYTTDTALDTTVRSALPSVSLTVRDVTAYPVTGQTVTAWPAYSVFDTVQSPSPDTLDLLSPEYIQDSLLVYTVTADAATYTNADGSVVPLVLWEDDDVYINGNYPIEPPSIGVATFDGLSRTGYPYNYPQYSSYGIADRLTSVPIDLAGYDPSDSLYLSFFFQPQGLSGDGNVQPQDSLVLEFYAPDEQFWYRVWSTPYRPLQLFEQVLVPIKLTKFLKSDFQFRFLNYATLSGSFDHWHLDYVRLGAQRTFDDTRLIDVAYMYPETSLLETYTSVTFSKFAQAPQSYMAQSIQAQQRNLDSQDRFITYGMLAREENAGPLSAFTNGLNPSNNAGQIFSSNHPVAGAPNNFTYDPALSTDAAFWRVKLWTNATPDINRYNDTVTFVQEISNYMAYDDGSAEMGYGLNASGARLAYRFDLVGGDSLRAVRMYFNPQANPPPQQNPLNGSFLITVWSSLTPPTVLHQNFTFSTPEYRLDGIDRFVEYPLDSTIWVENTFYIGWTQTNAVPMNIGFDRNRNNRNKIFYSTSGSFANTSFEGSLMMRPVFVAGYDPFAGLEEHSPRAVTIYPNPAGEAFTVECPSADGTAELRVFDAMGRSVLQEPYRAGGALSATALTPGIYIVRVEGGDGALIAQERLLIQR